MGPVETVQLRRYVLKPGRMDEFVAWFPELARVRRQYGFRLLFALADHERATFTWAVAYPGDEAAFRAVETTYTTSAERARAFETVPVDCAAEVEVGFVQPVV
jgi:hypothetical protein